MIVSRLCALVPTYSLYRLEASSLAHRLQIFQRILNVFAARGRDVASEYVASTSSEVLCLSHEGHITGWGRIAHFTEELIIRNRPDMGSSLQLPTNSALDISIEMERDQRWVLISRHVICHIKVERHDST